MTGASYPLEQPQQRPRKSLLWAVLLQCIPLLGASTCFMSAASGGWGGFVLLWFSVLFWGIGYLYLRRWSRYVLVLLVGPILAIGGCFASYHGVNYDYEHCVADASGGSCSDVGAADRAAAQTGLIVSGAVLILAVDAWRLADEHNASLESKLPDPGADPPQSGPYDPSALGDDTETGAAPEIDSF